MFGLNQVINKMSSQDCGYNVNILPFPRDQQWQYNLINLFPPRIQKFNIFNKNENENLK